MKPQQQGASAEPVWVVVSPWRWEAVVKGRRVAVSLTDGDPPYRVEVLEGRKAGESARSPSLKEAKRLVERMVG